MRRSICPARLLPFLAVILAVGCGSGRRGGHSTSMSSTAPTGLGSTFQFTRSPIDPAVIEFIAPLGNLNPPGHTLPTDHIYFYHHLNHRSAPQYDVIVPADGVIAAIQRGADDQLYIRASDAHMYYLGHLMLDSGFAQNQRVVAGQRLGLTSPLSFGLDLGLINFDLTQSFIAPARYSDNSLHCDAPLQYFSEPLKSELYARVSGTGVDRDGRINYDVPGHLGGNWFHESLSVADSAGPNGWTRHLSFVRDNFDPSLIRIGIGGFIAPAGVYTIGSADPDPASVTPAMGPITFQLASTAFGGPSGPFRVTMLSESRIRVEFGGTEQIYVR